MLHPPRAGRRRAAPPDPSTPLVAPRVPRRAARPALPWARAVTGIALLAGSSACDRAPVPPRMLNAEAPFRYPAALYEKRVQGNVVLRLHVDTAGRVLPESTRVVESSGYAGLDSSAIRGSEALRFAPAYRGRTPQAMSILFPVHFRHPGAPPMPGDTNGRGRG